MILTISSAAFYIIQNLIFHQPENTLFYLFQDLAFVPIQVAIVTFIINRLLSIIEDQKKNKKINVLISTFFTEVGSPVLASMSQFNKNHEELSQIVRNGELLKGNSSEIKKNVDSFKYDIYADPDKLCELACLLAEKKSFMLGLLENSNLLEHDSFTDMIWAVFHVADELQNRGDFSKLSKADIAHLSVDLKRAYPLLIQQWIGYMVYLSGEYPFLYDLAKRRNPFSSKQNYAETL